MAPSAINPPPETTSELVSAGIKHAIAKTAPSIAPHHGDSSTLQELDASKLMFTRNLNPKPVPEPNSPEVKAMNVYAGFFQFYSPQSISYASSELISPIPAVLIT